jgi:DNA-binding transcriptional MocR family regulator
MHRARVLVHPTQKGMHYGALTAKFLNVVEALLWTFHNAPTGVCFPSLKRLAEAAKCNPDTAAEAIKALEAVGLLSWEHGIMRVTERCVDLFGRLGRRERVVRTSNRYQLHDPQPAKRPESLPKASKSEFPSGTSNQVLSSLIEAPSPFVFDLAKPAEAALARLFLTRQERK